MKRRRKNKNFGWPHMFYHKATGGYLVCETLADVPEGFVERRQACDVKPVGVEEATPYDGPEVATASEAVVEEDETEEEEYETEAAAAEDDDTEDGDDGDNNTDKPRTLEDLEVTRKQAIAMLTEEGVDFKKNATNEKLAGLLEAFLEDETED